MPTYEFTAPDGRVLEVTGPTPPTESELDAMFAQAGTTEAPHSNMDQAIGIAKDIGIGALKGVGNTVFGLGKVVRDYTPIGRISDAILPGAFAQRPPELVPTNTAQKVGFTGEQIGEFFLPVGAVGKVGKAAEIGKSVGLTLAQGGSPTAAGVSGALTAVLPGGGATKKAAKSLRESAEKGMVQALGPTKEATKATAAKLAPEMLARGVRGSRGRMLEQASAAVAKVGPQLDDAYRTAAASGSTVSGDVIRGHLQLAAEQLMTKDAAGARVPIVGTERVIRKLGKMDDFIGRLGPDIPVDKAVAIKRTWDRIVSKAGLYGPKATATATDNADAWAVREGASAFRDLLNTNPSIEALNKEYAFWRGLKDVLKSTELRTQAQGSGLAAAIGATTGAAAGLASGEDIGSSLGQAAIGGLAFRKVTQLMQSPVFRTAVSSRLKAGLAEALASGKADQIERVAERILTAVPAQVQ